MRCVVFRESPQAWRAKQDSLKARQGSPAAKSSKALFRLSAEGLVNAAPL